MYASTNFKTKKAFKEAVAKSLVGDGPDINLYAPGVGSPKSNGAETCEGPWAPQDHTWYAQVEMKGGKVIKVK